MKRRVFTPEPRPHGARLAAAEARVAELTEENAGMRELLDIEPSYHVLCCRLSELEKHAAEIHKLIGRGTHDDAVMNFECAVSGLHDILQASRENSENNALLEEQIAALTTDLASGTLSPNQARVFTEAETIDATERSLRAAEEVIELTQAVGVPAAQMHLLVDYVYARPVGEPAKEIAGCMLTIYAAASALGVDAQAEFETEIARVQQPEVVERVRRRQKEKREALMTPDDASFTVNIPTPCNVCQFCGVGGAHIANCPALRA